MEASKEDGNGEMKETKLSQSHTLIKQLRQDRLRATKSSPHRNLELHHTRSFSEICHLHPSSTELNRALAYPKPRAIEALQHEHVGRPESVLEISALGTQDSDSDAEEDVDDAQVKGNEAMRKFLESNVSVPLDGALTSSSGSLESLESSDEASENELVMATWDNEGRVSVASSTTSINKHFFTPSGLLLYREQQAADALLDAKRLKPTPSSAERPMSPLAITRDNAELSDDGYNTGKATEETTECSCGLSSKFQDIKRLVKEYEAQYEDLVKKRSKQNEELKVLKKDNINLHREQNRLHIIIKQNSKQDEMVQELTQMLSIKEKHTEELNKTVKDLNEEATGKDEQIRVLRRTIGRRENEIAMYEEMFNEISEESSALVEALGRELGNTDEESTSINLEENRQAIVPILKKRRCSLKDDFKNFTQHIVHPNELSGEIKDGVGIEAKINEIQGSLHENFNEMAAGCRQALSHVEKAEESVKNIQRRSYDLETILRGKNGISEGDGGERRFELQRKDKQKDTQEKICPNKDCVKWQDESYTTNGGRSRVVDERERLECEFNERMNLLYEQNYRTQLKVEGLETMLTQRLESSNRGDETGPDRGTSGQRYANSETTRKYPNTLAGDSDKQENEYQKSLLTKKEKAYKELEDRLREFSQLTDTLNSKLDCTNEQFTLLTNTTLTNNKTLSRKETLAISGEILWEIKGIYEEHFSRIQQHFIEQKKENHSLKERLVIKECEEEVNKSYIESIENANALIQKELQASRRKCQVLKKELQDLKDRLLVTDTEQRLTLYFNGKMGHHNESLG